MIIEHKELGITSESIKGISDKRVLLDYKARLMLDITSIELDVQSNMNIYTAERVEKARFKAKLYSTLNKLIDFRISQIKVDHIIKEREFYRNKLKTLLPNHFEEIEYEKEQLL